MLLEINGQPVLDMAHQQVIELIKQTGNDINVVVTDAALFDEEQRTVTVLKPESGSLGIRIMEKPEYVLGRRRRRRRKD